MSKNTEAVECVEVRVKVPKGIIDCMKALGVNIDEWAKYSLINSFGADFDVFQAGADIFIDIEKLVEKHRLRDIPELKGYSIDC